MAADFNRLGGERRGPIRYAGVVARALFGYRAAHYTIDVDGRRLETDAAARRDREPLAVRLERRHRAGRAAGRRVARRGRRRERGRRSAGSASWRGPSTRTIDRAAGVTRLPAGTWSCGPTSPSSSTSTASRTRAATTVEARILPAAIHVRVRVRSGRLETTGRRSARRHGRDRSRSPRLAARPRRGRRPGRSRRPRPALYSPYDEP